MNLIEFKKVNLKFGEKEILRNFSLSINEGQKLVIPGKSGKGKSTLLRLLMGYKKHDSGDILINGKPMTFKDLYSTRQLFSYVNQDVTLRSGIVKDVLVEISKFSGNDYDGLFSVELANIFEFDMSLLDKEVDELSGGERQRLGIIIAIMLDRPIFLFDEITSALDKDLKKKVVDYFGKTDKTVISISHDNVWLDSGIFEKVVW